VVRIADNRIASRHDAVVESFQAAFLIVNPVIGGNEAAFRPPCSNECAPGRRAAPGMNEAHAPLTDKPPKTARIKENRGRVFRFRREADQLTASFGQFVLKTAAGRDHERAASPKRYRLRHLDR